ncbi:hypothetical protein HYT01_00765 [Candidatus Giovannonibacteria bacterium]|nr:hypothetical protein [Candidatus Giovannonibacteria bacterium]
MNNMKKYSSFLALALSVAASLLMIGYALAQADNIQFPVAELGNCADKEACKTYCDVPDNAPACISFAEKNNLMSREEAALARKITAGEMKGPGGCTTKDKCENFCNDISHIEECVAFAEENNIMPQKDLAEAKKVAAAIRQGIKPPACNNKAACDSYCGAGEHMEECMNFALKAGLMDEQERADAEKMLAAVRNGVKPPNCRGKEECDAYCSDEKNIEECANFAVAAGFIDQKQFEMMKKTKGRGPGGCKGKEECEAFCGNPDNQEACFQFGKENGLISEEEIKKMEEGSKMFMENINNAPEAVKACLVEILGDLSQVKPSREAGEKMKSCFEKFGSMGGQDGPGSGGPGGFGGPGAGSDEFRGSGQFGGPGGCTSPEECQAYCSSHPNECGAPPSGGGSFAPPRGDSEGGFSGSGQFSGPGGCSTPEECQAYCSSHPNECGVPPSGGGSLIPPPGDFQRPPSDGFQQPPAGYQQPPSGSYAPPPGDFQTPPQGDYQTPPPATEPTPLPFETSSPISLLNPKLLLSSVYHSILNWWGNR